MHKPKLIVVGVDGGCFPLIQPWLENGQLPNLKRMVDDGVSGNLRSCLPPVTCPNWRCYATGKNPGKLGLFWWVNMDVKNRRIITPAAAAAKTVDFWQFLNRAGCPTAVINTPLTYPPKPIDGYLISGGPDALENGFCYPDTLEAQLRSEFGYKVHNTVSYNTGRQRLLVDEILELIELRFKVAKFIMDRDAIDFLQVTTFYINALQHLFWNDEPVRKAWQIVDKWLGWFLDQGNNVWVMSDHGSMPLIVEFSINRWLEERGFLVLRNTFSDRIRSLGLTRERLSFMADTFGARQFLRKAIPTGWKHFIPDKDGAVRAGGQLHKIDWDRSVASGFAQGPLYVFPDSQSRRYLPLLEDLSDQLRHLHLPDGRNKVASDVKRADAIYHGPFMEFAPDLVIEYNYGVHISGSVGKKDIFSRPSRWRADNRREGLFIGFGTDMNRRQNVKGLSILDLAPTILHLFGVPVSEDIDGRVCKKLFAVDSEPARRNVVRAPEDNLTPLSGTEIAENKEIALRLKGLGYMD